MPAFPPILFVFVAAALAPVVWAATRRWGLSVIVIELGLGIAIGPQALSLVTAESGILLPLSKLGMAFLFFIAGTEIDLAAIGAPHVRRASFGWLGGLLVAYAIALAFAGAGLTEASSVVAIALGTSALGIVMPILRDARVQDTPFGRYVIAASAIGEIGPIVLVSLVLAHRFGTGTQVLLTVAFAALVLALTWLLARGARVPAILAPLRRGLDQSGQLPIRICFVLVAVLAWTAESFGLDLALGALAAGMMVGFITRGGERSHDLHSKLDAIGYGFLVPLFFIVSGMQLDVRTLLEGGKDLVLLAAFLAALPLVRMPTIILARPTLGTRAAVGAGLASATTLSLIVVLTQAAAAAGVMGGGAAASLVGAGIVSVVVFPTVALKLAGAVRVAPERGADRELF